MEDLGNKQGRAIIRICVTNIPGEICRRPNTLGQIFCTNVLGRNFEHNVELPAYDMVHIPPGFDSEKDVKRWFVCDLNVQCELEREDVEKLPHAVYQASYIDDKWCVRAIYY